MQDHSVHAPGVESEFLPHGFCYLWDPQLLWTHVAADFLIGAAYIVISITLAWLVHRVRRDIPFSWVFVAFGLFIITCGLTHFMEIWTLWKPVYWLSGAVKVVTAAASVATAIAMPFTVPRAVTTIRDARISREREVAAARAAALEEQNELLREQAIELEEGREAAEYARHAAEAASEAKTAFLRTMSHELRTPLNAIMGYEQLLELGIGGPVTEAQVSHLQRISTSATHLLGLIDEILTLSQGGGDGPVLASDEVDVPAFVADVVAMIQPLADGRQLALTTDVRTDAVIHTDARRLRQVLVNLLGNAIKFTAEGRITVTAEADGDTIVFRVADTGIGIAPEHMERIWEPFWQAEQGTTRVHGGSGLGLSVSRHLAILLRGTLDITSERGVGTIATLRVPRRAE